MRIALCQIAATSDPTHNLDLVLTSLSDAGEVGAALAVLPEASLARFGTRLADIAEPLDGPWAQAVRDGARGAELVAVVGMFTPAAGGRVRNTLLVTGPGFETSYDKVHLFDAFGSQESHTIEAGDDLVTVVVAGVTVGLATCYDLRFPAQFTALAAAGAEVVVVPSSWGDGPGKGEQWELLVRARAIDATAFVLAADQADPRTAGLRPTPRAPGGIGRSLVVSPLGEIVDGLGADPGMLVVEIDTSTVARVREQLPVLQHARPWTRDDVSRKP